MLSLCACAALVSGLLFLNSDSSKAVIVGWQTVRVPITAPAVESGVVGDGEGMVCLNAAARTEADPLPCPFAVGPASSGLARPKSRSLAPDLVSITLPGFRSRCTTPARWAFSSASANLDGDLQNLSGCESAFSKSLGHVPRCHVADRTVQPDAVIAIHILLNQAFASSSDNGVPGRMHSLFSDSCQRSSFPFDCGLARRGPDMCRARDANEVLEIAASRWLFSLQR